MGNVSFGTNTPLTFPKPQKLYYGDKTKSTFLLNLKPNLSLSRAVLRVIRKLGHMDWKGFSQIPKVFHKKKFDL